MSEKVIIAGSRDIDDFATVQGAINDSPFTPTEIVSGGASGVDSLGERYAKEHGVAVSVFEADWNTHGNSAGPKRNTEMAEYADAVVLVWDGESAGTRDMFTKALERRLDVYVCPVGYNGVFKNDLNEQELLRRYPEIKQIDSIGVRSQAVEGLLKGHPDYIWDIASSRTGKYHPPDERGDHGQWLHVKRMFYAYDEMVRSLKYQGEVTDWDIACGKAAVFYHDLFKNGLPPGALDSSHDQHDTLAAEYVRQFTDLPELVARLCDVHNGGWGNDTSPDTPHERIFHQADMLASRNGNNIGIYEPAEELEEVSDRLIDVEEV